MTLLKITLLSRKENFADFTASVSRRNSARVSH